MYGYGLWIRVANPPPKITLFQVQNPFLVPGDPSNPIRTGIVESQVWGGSNNLKCMAILPYNSVFSFGREKIIFPPIF